MNTKTLVAIIAIVIIGLAFFVFRDGTDPADPSDDNNLGAAQLLPGANGASTLSDPLGAEVAAVVTYTDEGFDPSVVTVENGEAVRFVNNSTRSLWVASANHPTHAVYPEKTSIDCLGSAFDACSALEIEESWDFTFTSSGDWGYHDHLRASMTGVVSVVDEL